MASSDKRVESAVKDGIALETILSAVRVLLHEVRDLRAHQYGLDGRTTEALDAAESALSVSEEA